MDPGLALCAPRDDGDVGAGGQPNRSPEPAAFSGFCSYTNGTRLPPLDHPKGRRTMLDRRQVLVALGTSALVALAPTALFAAASIKPDDTSALLVIDVQ